MIKKKNQKNRNISKVTDYAALINVLQNKEINILFHSFFTHISI